MRTTVQQDHPGENGQITVMTQYARGRRRVTPTAVRAAVAAAVRALSVGVSGCAATGATGAASQARSADAAAPVVLGVTGEEYQQRLVDSYDAAFGAAGREVEFRDIAAEDRLSSVHSGEFTVVLGCVGELLDVLDPDKGDELRELYAEEETAEGEIDPAQWRDITHTTMFSALPTDLQASDPGEAVGCPDDSLPQNTVAIYRNTALERADRRALNNVAGGVTSDELAAEGDED